VATHPYLGVASKDGVVADGSAKRAAAVLTNVVSGTPADKAGLQANDAIIAVDGNPIDGSLSLVAQVRERNVGDSVTLTVLRNGQRKNIDVTLVAKPTTTHNAAILLTDAVPATPSAGSQSCMAPHRAPARGRRCVVLAIALEPVAPHTKLTGPVHESPKILGDPCDHDRRTGPDAGVVDGPEVRRATPDGQQRWPDPASARALVVA
jgi:membrane-associated protease RseP (regulator of RpoE activity)